MCPGAVPLVATNSTKLLGRPHLPLLDVSVMYNRYRYSQLDYEDAAGEYRLSDDKRDAQSVSLSVEYRF